MISRRQFVTGLVLLPVLVYLPKNAPARDIPDLTQRKILYAERLKKILASGELPCVDIESSCYSGKIDIESLAKNMDRLNIGLMALSADIGSNQSRKGVRFDNLFRKLAAAYPDRFLPVGNGGLPPVWTEFPDEFLDAQEAAIQKKQIILLGEYEFRHYPSPRQAKRGRMDRDVDIPIDGPIGHRLFSLSERAGIAFQIHYEIEDRLLAPLEKMLEQYPKAKVIWCHLAQIRYKERSSRYTPGYVDGLVQRFPNLYFDTAFGSALSIYPPSGQRHARIWQDDGVIKGEWRDLIVAHAERFLSALDLGQDRMERIVAYDRNHRDFLKCLPPVVQHHIAYRNAWSLLFGEDFD